MEILSGRHRKGWTPERFCAEYPWLDLAETYLAIAFYLRNKETIDACLIETHERAQSLKIRCRRKIRFPMRVGRLGAMNARTGSGGPKADEE